MKAHLEISVFVVVNYSYKFNFKVHLCKYVWRVKNIIYIHIFFLYAHIYIFFSTMLSDTKGNTPTSHFPVTYMTALCI